MTWGSWNEFIAMGGHGFYVWGSYGMAFAAIALEIWALARRSRAAGKAGA